MHHRTWLDQEMLYIAHNPQKILEKVTSCCSVLPSIYFIHLLLLWTWHMPLQTNEKDNKYLKEMKEAQMCCSKECQVRFSIQLLSLSKDFWFNSDSGGWLQFVSVNKYVSWTTVQGRKKRFLCNHSHWLLLSCHCSIVSCDVDTWLQQILSRSTSSSSNTWIHNIQSNRRSCQG